MNKEIVFSAALASALSFSHPVFAADDADLAAIRAEIQAMQAAYEERIQQLEGKIAELETKTGDGNAPVAQTASRNVYGNAFNPSIGATFNGQYRNYSNNSGDIAGFAVGEEGERGAQGFAVDHTELNVSANVDDAFYGSATIALAEHGGSTEVEIEEAYIQTLPGAGLPDGVTVKAGRALWTVGYLNEHHTHADDFADRPLPYRAFLDGAFNDDGVEVSYVAPTEIYLELGGGAFRGNDFPFGASDGEGVGVWSAFARLGGDIGQNQSWRLGATFLSGEAKGNRLSNEDMVAFTGDTDLIVGDVRYTWAPGGNPRQEEVTLQAEYFHRNEDGSYNDMNAGTGVIAYDENSSGWYGQAVYKFAPQWRVGARFSQLFPGDAPAGLVGSALDAGGFDPRAYSVMADWTNSEFSRVRVQFNREELARGQNDNQFLVQYIMSLGAHGAHKY